MPRVFTAANTEYVHTGTTAPGGITGYPWSGSVWLLPTALDGTSHVFWYHGDSSENNDEYWWLFLIATTDLVRFDTGAGAANENTTTTSAVADNTWVHIGAVAASATSRLIYIKGVVEGVESTMSLTPGPAVDRWAFGARFDTTADLPTSCRAFWPAMWNDALSAHDMLRLAKGQSPYGVRRDALRFFPPFLYDEDRDRISGQALTAVNTPTVHPSIPPNCHHKLRRAG